MQLPLSLATSSHTSRAGRNSKSAKEPSLVALDQADRPVSVSTTGEDRWNTVVWVDHRAIAVPPHDLFDRLVVLPVGPRGGLC